MSRRNESSGGAGRFLVWLVVVGMLVPAWVGLGVARGAEATTQAVLDPILSRALGSGFDGIVHAVTETADGGFLVAGAFRSLDRDGSIPDGLVRFDAEGNLDTKFNDALGSGFSHAVWAVTLASGSHEGSFYAVGEFLSFNGTPASRVARLDEQGAFDSAFMDALGGGFTGHVDMAYQLADGDILFSGNMTRLGGKAVSKAVRLSPDGELDPEFTANLGDVNGAIWSVAEDQDGRILIGGEFFRIGEREVNSIARLSAQGELDVEFFPRESGLFVSFVRSIKLDEAGRIMAAGNFTYLGLLPVGRLARFSSEGELDLAFNANLGAGFAGGAAYSMNVTADGAILVAGAFTSANGVPVGRLARVSADGRFDAAFNEQLGTGFGGTELHAVRMMSGGIVVGGHFTSLNGDASVPSMLARLVPGTIEMGAVGDQTATVGQPVDVALSASVDPVSAVEFAAAGLPDGLDLDSATGRITGTPTVAGRFPVQVTAEAAPVGPRADVAFTWTVNMVASVSGAPGSGVVGRPYEFTFDVAGDPVPTVTVAPGSELPPGLTLSESGVLSGTPTAAGLFGFTVVAANGVGVDATETVSLRVDEAPSVLGDPTPGVVGEPYWFKFEVAGSPVPSVSVVDESGLPAGLTLSESGVLSGIPTASGDAEFTVVASNGVGADATATVSMRVDEAPAVQAPWLEHVHPERLPGHTQVVRGGGFVPGEGVSFAMNSARVSLGAAVADDAGRVDWEFVVPDETAPGPHTLTASSESGVLVSATFVVVPHPTQADPGEQDDADEQLAWTGSQVGVAALLAATLIVLGSVLVGRRRLIH